MADSYEVYPGIWDSKTTLPIATEIGIIQRGGKWMNKASGKMVGNGIEYHFRKALSLIWPEIVWHKWNELFVKEWLSHKYVGVLGPANSSKTCTAALCHLMAYYCAPENTTVIVCSNTKESLENRIWGEMKKLHRQATAKYRWLPGNLIEGKLRIVTDDRSTAVEGRDFRNGLMGVAAYVGGAMRGISSLVGIKNDNLYICGDELQTLPRAFLDSLSNLMKPTARPGHKAVRKCTGMGNPSDTLDSLGALCEPAAHIGGWDSGIDQRPLTKTWPTRWPGGICIQFCGSDSPNKDFPPDKPKYSFLIGPRDLEEESQKWGVDDWHYTMFCEGRMPRGQGSRRVITRQMCQKFGAMNEALWQNSNRTSIAFLDAAYRGVGGDRCVFGSLRFGQESVPLTSETLISNLIEQELPPEKRKTILELVKTEVIPINGDIAELPEDQIVKAVMAKCEEASIPPENFFFDAGMRTSLVSAFARLWSPKVNSIDFGGRPSDRIVSANIPVACKDYYFNFVSELWYNVRHVIEAGQFRGMTEDVMLEGCAREWLKVGANKIQVEPKEEMKKKCGRSPDLFDALVCGVWGALQKGFVIRSINNERAVTVSHAWKRELRNKANELRIKGQLNYN
jgi:hypothetical protein